MARNNNTYKDRHILTTLLVVVTLGFSLVSMSFSPLRWPSMGAIAINFLYSAFAIFCFKELIICLDKKYAWTESIPKRIIIQLLSSSIIYFLIQTLIFVVIEPNNGGTTPTSTELLASYSMGLAFLMLLNTVYIYWGIKNVSPDHGKGAQNISQLSSAMMITGTSKGRRIQMRISDIVLIKIHNEIVKGHTAEKEELYLKESLSELEEILKKDQFFRANRQTIIHKSAINKVIHNANRSITILSDIVEEEITISRHKALPFQRWMSNAEVSL